MMTAPMVDYKIHWLKMMSVPESRAVVGRHDGINGRDSIQPSYAFVEQPQTNGVAERFNRTLKEQIIHGRIYRNIAELRNAVRGFVEQYNVSMAEQKGTTVAVGKWYDFHEFGWYMGNVG